MMTTSRLAGTALAIACGTLLALPVLAQNYPITPAQRATANQVAQAGVPISELAANAPDSYTVKSGDTLWAISKLFLKSPWRWPELWGMNQADIKNPHLIYPGQKLFLDKKNGRATLRTSGSDGSTPTVKLSPRIRTDALGNGALPSLDFNQIESFLAEPMIVDESGLRLAPRIVANAHEGRVLLTRGDRAYARGPANAPLLDDQRQEKQYRLFRNATPLKDPDSGEVLAYQAEFIGSAALVRSESAFTSAPNKDGKSATEIVPATIDIISAKEEILAGDRLVPMPERQFPNYAPSAPQGKVDGRIVSVYGSAVVNAAQNQVVVMNRGSKDGIQNGNVLAILKDGRYVQDKTDETKPQLKLPDERNGLLMVFRTYERVSYALVLEITEAVRVGDRLTNPR